MKTIEERANDYISVFRRDMYKTISKDSYIQGATDQQAIFDKLPKIKAWVVMDWNGEIRLHFEKPIKWTNVWGSYRAVLITEDQLPEGCNPQWTDDEPIEVELTINLKKG